MLDIAPAKGAVLLHKLDIEQTCCLEDDDLVLSVPPLLEVYHAGILHPDKQQSLSAKVIQKVPKGDIAQIICTAGMQVSTK